MEDEVTVNEVSGPHAHDHMKHADHKSENERWEKRSKIMHRVCSHVVMRFTCFHWLSTAVRVNCCLTRCDQQQKAKMISFVADLWIWIVLSMSPGTKSQRRKWIKLRIATFFTCKWGSDADDAIFCSFLLFRSFHSLIASSSLPSRWG